MTNRTQLSINGSQSWDVQTNGQLLRALNDSAAANPTPQQVIEAIGRTLRIDAGGIFPTRGEEDTSIALYFRTNELRDAFVQAYTDKLVGVDTVRTMSKDGESLTMEEWDGPSHLPAYIMDLLHADTWSTAIELYHDNKTVGLLWMLGSPKHNSKPPANEIVRSISGLASQALQRTVGRTWILKDADELQLLEELSGILTQQRPFVERLQAVVERAREATGFASIGLAVQGAKTKLGGNACAIAYLQSAYSKEYAHWSAEHFASDEYLNETCRFFEGRHGPLVYADPAQLATLEAESRRWILQNSIRFLAQIPLRYGDEYLGTLRICSAFGENETWERLRVFTALASHIAAILKSIRLFEEVQVAHASLTHSHHATVRTLAHAAESRDPFTGDHLKNIEAYTRALARILKMPDEDAEAIRFGAVLHDVGKLRVPDSILLKSSKLNTEEWTVIRQHPLYGEEILIHSNIPAVALQIARWHHERWDGTGYPDGLTGNQIPLAVQIVTIADVFDALTSTRPYKHAWPASKALQEIQENVGRQFSPQIVEALRTLHEDGTVGEILATKIATPIRQGSADEAA